MNISEQQHPVILFDGVCNLCSGAVAFIIKRDKSARYKFAALQSENGKNLISKFNLSPDKIDSILLLENDKYFIKSTAVIKICRDLRALWPLVYIFILIPKSLRDYVYDLIAKNRYRWFGKKEQCLIPGEELESRFLS
jgi:predicted DCC family thiol-disulfide oxidoreductase YuxK